MKTRKPKTVAYLRVSTNDQDLEKNKADVLHFANNKDFGKVKFVFMIKFHLHTFKLLKHVQDSSVV